MNPKLSSRLRKFEMKTNLISFAIYLVVIIALPTLLSLLVNDPAPVAAAASTPDVVHTNAYQLDSGQFVRRWIDEEMQLLCLTIQSQYGMTGYPVVTTGITCIPLATTAYGLPAVEIK